jgi:peptidoglycan-N-acetylglucosamine deacetylase
LRVALTVDTEFGQGGHEGARHLDTILSCLSDSDVRATFFVQGRWALAHPSLLKRIRADGHLIGNHSYLHLPLAFVPSALVKADVLRSERAIVEVSGCSPRPWFRCPYGSGGESPRIQRALQQVGYAHVGWTSDSGDYRRGSSAGGVFERVMGACEEARDGVTVVLLHSWPEATAGALPLIVSALKERSATFVGVDEIENVGGGWGRASLL